MRILIAPDTFKGSLGAREAANAIALGWSTARPNDSIHVLPLADGGEGTLDVLYAARADAQWRVFEGALGPNNEPVNVPWLTLDDGDAAVELAAACGLGLLRTPDPMRAHTCALGQVIQAALSHATRRLIVGLGGSGSTDGGVGALSALGAVFLNASGDPIRMGGGGLESLRSVNLRGLALPPPTVLVLSDVDNPLLGTRGAAIAFSPQKGADARQVRALENGLTTLARHLPGDPTARGTGAAGGTGYGLATAWSAQIVSGSNAVASAVGLAAALHAADFVITGEGQLDESSFNGKVVGCVARTAQDASVPIYIIAGKIDDAALEHSKIHVVGSTDLVSVAGTVDRAMKDTCNVLSAAARSVANNLSRTNEDYACHTLKSTS